MAVLQAFDSAESPCRLSSPGTGFGAAPAPPEGWVQHRGSSEVLSELSVLQLCLLQGWAELCAGPCGTGWVPNHRLTLGSLSRSPWNHSLAGTSNPSEKCMGVSETQEWAQLCLSLLSLSALSVPSARETRSQMSQCWCFLAAWAVQPCLTVGEDPLAAASFAFFG